MVRLVENERSWAIDLISEINNYLSSVSLNIKRAGGETTINNYRSGHENDRKVMFPDVLLYSDVERNNLLQGWEIKLPDISVQDEEYIKDAQDKADKLGLNSTVLWNFRDVVFYVKKDDKWVIEHQWDNLNSISTRNEVKKQQHLWKEFLKELLNDLSIYHQDGIIEQRNLVEISNSLVAYLIGENKQSLANYLQEQGRGNRLIEIDISKWWESAEEEYLQDENNKFTAYSKTILLNWIIRFTFANLIAGTHMDARKVREVNIKNTPEEVNMLFQDITETSDFYTIFASQKYNDLLPIHLWERLTDYNAFLNDKIIKHEIMQKMLENSVSQYKREIVGQYTTPEKLVLLLVYSTVLNLEGHTIDPCCGTGIIPKKIKELKMSSGIREEEIHETTWGSDKLSFPLQIANMSFTTDTSMNLINKIFKKNVFELIENTPINLISPKDGKEKEYSLPKFTNIISNLPFVPFEKIEESEEEYLKDLVKEVQETSEANITFSRRSDYYYYIIAYLDELLADNGRIGVITSNSWLGTTAGKNFYQLLIDRYNLKNVIISGNKKWFPNADVMSSIIVLEKKDQSKIQNEPINFIVLKEALNKLENTQIIDIGNDILSNNPNDLISRKSYTVAEVESYTSSYNISLNSLFFGIDWLDDIQDKLLPFEEVFDTIRGKRRGWDKLFFPEGNHNIEPQYLKRVLKSSKNIKKYTARTDTDAFCCSKSKEELIELGHTGTLDWINKFERGTNTKGNPLPVVLKTTNRKWYEMKPEGSIAEFVTSVNPDSRLFWAKIEQPSFINQRLIGVSRNEVSQHLDTTLLHALLNSIVGQFFIEATGFARGLGALDLNATSISNNYILNPNLLTTEQKNEIIQKFNELKNVSVGDALSELELEKKEKLDRTILKVFRIENQYESIKKSLSSMIRARLSVKN